VVSDQRGRRVGDSFADSLVLCDARAAGLAAGSTTCTEAMDPAHHRLTRAATTSNTQSGFANSTEAGLADVCFAQIGSNDMQSIPISKSNGSHTVSAMRGAYAGLRGKWRLILTEAAAAC